ncbi:chromosome segregation protein SMC [Parvularcula sp. LCG005]|uniref:chromosome segregation protein SMC n=1 Tax=Parvularcula sp. LCG005 TaxID=3078805 RepID=UPI002942B778|nr:chromosome segregation protein SMC [Parvularcula sp. LCG005]WOI52834.1 chromosome segregation protein SMC [Parvularcula sp. LCG005]
MDFQKLRLTGFKSFVEPTDFEIRPGLTGIVGPNGCGKSNLLEGLRWVMGATSAKALRAGGMEDVIFSGTGTPDRPGRPGRSWAEVSLEISNEDRTAPAEYNEHPTLEVSRRITKKADGTSSTYRINGKEVRAKDVQLLFADAATGANSPALVRQGQVSDLINAKPENRRKFLEEAAGVTGLYQRRHEAELRLKAASTNLERLDDVTGELESQRQVLSRQARQATRYRNIAGHLKKAEALLAYGRWKEAADAVTASEENLKTVLADLEQAVRAAASTNAEREKQHDLVEPLRQKEAEAAAALHRLEVEQQNYDREVARAKADLERLVQTKERLERELAREKDLGSDAAQALEALATEETQLNDRAASEKQRLDDAEREVNAAQERLNGAEAEAEKAQSVLAQAEAERRALTSAAERARQGVARLQGDLQRAEQEKASFEAQGSKSEEIAQKEARLAEVTAAAETAAAALERATADRRRAEEALEGARAPRDAAMAEVNGIQAEVDTLRRILAASEPKGRAILEDISVDEGFEGALAAALDDGLEAGDDAEADQHWSPLGAEEMMAQALPSGAQSLAGHVRAPALLSRRLKMIGVVTAEEGAALAAGLAPGQRLVSREGDLWRWDGYVAKAGAKTAAALRLEQKRQLAAREADLEAAFERRDAAEQALGTHKADLVTATAQVAEARKMNDEARQAAITLERDINRLSAEEQKRQSRSEAISARVADVQERLTIAEAEANEATGKLEGLPDLSRLQDALATARRDRDDARNQNGRARGIRADLRREADARLARLRQIAEQRDGWIKRKETASERTQMVVQTHEETVAALAKAERVPAELEERRETLAETLAAAESRRRHAADQLAGVQSSLVDAERAARTASEAASLARETKARVEAQAEAARERLTLAVERTQEVQEGDPKDLLVLAEHGADDALPDHDSLESKINKLKAEREALGGVNLCADQEMEEIDGRLSEIATEREDCEAAIAKLRGAIGGLNRDGRQRLLDAFDTVNSNFQRLFVELFGGGQAELRLVDSDDPLEAGLEIFASPPGKKLSSMSLMSGGEQALTATALIFAVFKSNPAPVCVLDEIDAPLDDANTDRFCAMLARMAQETNTRFIAITHHPLTMSRMDRLYGVTMIERGVSQLVSVDLAEAEKLAA